MLGYHTIMAVYVNVPSQAYPVDLTGQLTNYLTNYVIKNKRGEFLIFLVL